MKVRILSVLLAYAGCFLAGAAIVTVLTGPAPTSQTSIALFLGSSGLLFTAAATAGIASRT